MSGCHIGQLLGWWNQAWGTVVPWWPTREPGEDPLYLPLQGWTLHRPPCSLCPLLVVWPELCPPLTPAGDKRGGPEGGPSHSHCCCRWGHGVDSCESEILERSSIHHLLAEHLARPTSLTFSIDLSKMKTPLSEFW